MHQFQHLSLTTEGQQKPHMLVVLAAASNKFHTRLIANASVAGPAKDLACLRGLHKLPGQSVLPPAAPDNQHVYLQVLSLSLLSDPFNFSIYNTDGETHQVAFGCTKQPCSTPAACPANVWPQRAAEVGRQ